MQAVGIHAVTRLEFIFEAVNLSKQPAQPSHQKGLKSQVKF